MSKKPKQTPLQIAVQRVEELEAAITSYKAAEAECVEAVKELERNLSEAQRDLDDTRSLLNAQLEKLEREVVNVETELSEIIETTNGR